MLIGALVGGRDAASATGGLRTNINLNENLLLLGCWAIYLNERRETLSHGARQGEALVRRAERMKIRFDVGRGCVNIRRRAACSADGEIDGLANESTYV